MIDTLINKLGGLLEKHFLFASFLPSFCLIVGNLLIAAAAIGIEGSLIWFDALDASHQSLLAAALFIVTFLVAYLLSSLRGMLLGLWSGVMVPLPVVSELLRQRQQRKYLALSESRFVVEPWAAVERELADEILPHWVGSRQNPLDDAGRRDERNVLARIGGVRRPDEFRHLLKTRIVPLFEKYDGESLTDMYRHIRQVLSYHRDEAEAGIRRDRIRLDLTYGSYAAIHPTLLGNVVEAYNQYPYKRYGMDGEVLWPRLMQVIPATFDGAIQDKKAFLDFSLAMATGLVATAVAVLFYGPLLHFCSNACLTWPATAIGLVIVGAIFYNVAVTAARDFGNTLRAACDLFRLDLMKALGRPWPPDLPTERAQWKELSQLAVYGTIDNFILRQPGSPAASRDSGA